MPITGNTDLAFVKGDTWEVQWSLLDAARQPLDLTGVTARLHLRTAPGAALTIEASSTNGRMTVGAGTVRMRIEAVDTALVTAGTYLYSLELTWPDGTVKTVVQGRVVVDEDVTL